MVEDRVAEVEKWSKFMRQKLLEHADKGTWKGEPVLHLLGLLLIEVDELLRAKTRTEAYREAADIANFAFMIAENKHKEQNGEETTTNSTVR